MSQCYKNSSSYKESFLKSKGIASYSELSPWKYRNQPKTVGITTTLYGLLLQLKEMVLESVPVKLLGLYPYSWVFIIFL